MYNKDAYHAKLHKVGVLLVNGLNSGLSDMGELAGFLRSYNMVTRNVLLSGRGTYAHGMLSIDWSEWSNVIHRELQQLKQRCRHVFLVGHSLGGALCLHVSVIEPVAGIVTMCAPVYSYPWMFPAVRVIKPESAKSREDLHSYEARRRSKADRYSGTRLAPVESTLRYLPWLQTELPSVTAPTLIMTAIYDHVVPTRDGQAIYRLISSQEKSLVKFRRSSHLLMKDHDREEVFARALDFIQSHARGV